jgi:hypothetical protein
MPQYLLDSITYHRQLRDAAKLGATIALAEVGQLPKYLSQREAYRKYGAAAVKRWLEQGWIAAAPSGEHRNSKWRYSIVELELASSRSAYEKSPYHPKEASVENK